MKVRRKSAGRAHGDVMTRGAAPARSREVKKSGPRAGTRTRPQEPRVQRQGPQTIPAGRPAQRPARAKSATQAKARAKARKAKAPKAIRPPLRDRLLARLATVDFSPRTLIAKIPFVVLVIGALAVGLGITLWLSTDSAQRSYQLGNARALNDALTQQKEALERDVLVAQSAPALADAARNLGMIPSRDTAHLVLDPAGNWVVVGQPKPAEGAPPPPLNFKLPDQKPPAPAKPAPAGPAKPAPPAAAAPEVPVVLPPPPGTPHLPAGGGLMLAPLPGPPAAPPVAGDTLVIPPAAPAAPLLPTVAAVPAVPAVPVMPDVPAVSPGVAPPGAPQ